MYSLINVHGRIPVNREDISLHRIIRRKKSGAMSLIIALSTEMLMSKGFISADLGTIRLRRYFYILHAKSLFMQKAGILRWEVFRKYGQTIKP